MNTKIGNPAVVGLAGFGLTTLLLQFHNLGFSGLGPIVASGFIFGGLAQFIAGLMEQKTGNNFGFAAFTTYGAFWIGLGIIWLLNHFNVYASTTTEVGLYLLGFTFLTAIYFVGALFIHTAMVVTFGTLLLGFIFLDIGHFGFPVMNKVGAIDLIICVGAAWYMLAAIVINQVAGRELLKVGKPWLTTGVDVSSRQNTPDYILKQKAERIIQGAMTISEDAEVN